MDATKEHFNFLGFARMSRGRRTGKPFPHTAAINSMVAESGVTIEVRPSKYLNNLIEQDHAAIQRIVRPMLGFKDFNCARRLIAGIETMHMVKKRQLDGPQSQALSAGEPFYSLAI